MGTFSPSTIPLGRKLGLEIELQELLNNKIPRTSVLGNASMSWEGGSHGEAMEALHLSHSTPSPIHLSCWVVPGLHPLIIKLVVITVALS